MRFAASTAVAILVALAGLASYEVVFLCGLVIAIGLGIVNFVALGKQAVVLKKLQQDQGDRIDRLPPPPGE